MSNVPADLKYTQVARVGAPRSRRHGHRRHHRSRAAGARRPGVRRSAGSGPARQRRRSLRGGRIGQGRLRRLQPGRGEVVAGNADLGGQPELINTDPYGAGWIMRIRPDDKAQFAAMLDAKAYEAAARRRNALTAEGAPCRSFRTPTTTSATCSPRSARSDIDDLFDEIPAELRIAALAGVPPALNEMEVGRLMTERAARDGTAAQLHRRRRLRAPHPGGGVGDRDARRVLQRLHAVPGRGEPGHAAADLRIPDDDGEPDRHGRLERVALRRRLGARRSVPDGGARASQVEVAAHPGAGRVEPDLPRGACTRSPATRASSSSCCPRPEGRPDARSPTLEKYRRRGHHRARDPAAEFLRRARGRRRAHRLGARERRAGHRRR